MNETEFENKIRDLLKTGLDSTRYYIMENKKNVDIVIVDKKISSEKLYFIEVKYEKENNRRLGFGQKNGRGLQPEILKNHFNYFEDNMRWIIGTEKDNKYRLLTNQEVRENMSGGIVGKKYNGIQKKMLDKYNGLSDKELIENILQWLK